MRRIFGGFIGLEENNDVGPTTSPSFELPPQPFGIRKNRECNLITKDASSEYKYYTVGLKVIMGRTVGARVELVPGRNH